MQTRTSNRRRSIKSPFIYFRNYIIFPLFTDYLPDRLIILELTINLISIRFL